MKRFSILIILVLTLLCGCHRLSSDDIPGVWHVEDYQIDMKGLSPTVIASAKSIASSMEYTFNSDETFEITGADDYMSEGKWEFNPDNQELSLFYKKRDLPAVWKYHGNYQFIRTQENVFGTETTLIEKEQ